MQLCGRPRQIWSRGVAGLDVCDRDLLSICAAAVALKRKLFMLSVLVFYSGLLKQNDLKFYPWLTSTIS